MLLSEAACELVKHLHARGRSPDTCRAYREDLKRFGRFMSSVLGVDPQIEQVTRAHVEAYSYHLYERGLSPSTRHGVVSVMRGFFRYCVDVGWLGQSPAEKVPDVTVPRTLPKYLDSSEVKAFLDHCYSPLAKVIAGTLYYTGLRVGELCALKLDDLDIRRGTLRVARGKGGKERIVPLGRKARDLFMSYVANLRPEVDSDQLFITPRGHVLNRQWARTCIRREKERQGLKDHITPHTFRHSHATALYQAGVGIPTIAAILGHSDIGTTQIYTHLSSQDMLDAVDKLT